MKGTKGKSQAKRRNQQLATKNYVRKVVDNATETKVHTWQTSSSTGLTGVIYNLLGPAGQRLPYEGSKFQIIRITFNYVVGVADTDNQVRETIIKSKSSSYTPGVADVFSGGVVAPFIDTIDYVNNKKDFALVSDKHRQLGNTDRRTFVYSRTLTYKNWVVNTDNFTSADYQGKGIPYLILSSDSAAVPHPAFNLFVQVLYKDA